MNTAYRRMVQKVYEEDVLWRILEEGHLLSSYLLGYVACFSKDRKGKKSYDAPEWPVAMGNHLP